MWRLLAKSLSSGFDQEYCFSDHSSLFGECGLWSLRQRPCLAEWGVPGMFMRSTGLPWRSKGRVKCWLQRWTFLGMDKELAQLGPRTDSYKAWLELRKGQPNLGTSFSWRRARGGHTEDKKGALRVQVSDTLMVLLACQGNPVRQELQTPFYRTNGLQGVKSRPQGHRTSSAEQARPNSGTITRTHRHASRSLVTICVCFCRFIWGAF